MFQQGRFTGLNDFLGDYYITLSTERDYENILGTRVKWHFYNGKLFIYPNPIDMIVGIIYKSSIDIDEINSNQLIRKFALAMAKQILGTIRATFGGTMPGGGEMITLRGESLISEGKEEEREALEKMQKLSPPLGFEFG